MRHDEWIDELKSCADYLKNNAANIVQSGRYAQKITVTITITHKAAATVEIKKDILPKEVVEALKLLEERRNDHVNERCEYFSRDGCRECKECQKPKCKKYWAYHEEVPDA